jgi:hypothetical protein
VAPIGLSHVRGPVTETFRLRFRPALRYFDVRTAILRRFDEEGRLQGFTVSDEDVHAALAGFQWLSITPSGLTLDILEAVKDPGEVWSFVERICTELDLRAFSHARVSYQHLAGLPYKFEEAVARGQRRLVANLSTAEVTFDDWALLSDISLAGPPASKGTMEFGTVQRHEIQPRLSRMVGRGPGMLHIGQREWPLDGFKDVSLYADTDLTFIASPGREQVFLEDAAEFWSRSRAQITRLIDGWCNMLADDHTGGD